MLYTSLSSNRAALRASSIKEQSFLCRLVFLSLSSPDLSDLCSLNNLPFWHIYLGPTTSFQHPLKADTLDTTTAHRCTHIALEAFSVGLEIFCCVLVERVGCVRLEKEKLLVDTVLASDLTPLTSCAVCFPSSKTYLSCVCAAASPVFPSPPFSISTFTSSSTYLQPNNNRIKIQHRLPVLPQDVQTHIPLQINVRVIDLLQTLDLWRIMREVLVDGEAEVEGAGLVHAFVRVDG
jgi:hypothetical protein